MNIILPIMIVAIVVGVTSPKQNTLTWLAMTAAIAIVVGHYYLTN